MPAGQQVPIPGHIPEDAHQVLPPAFIERIAEVMLMLSMGAEEVGKPWL